MQTVSELGRLHGLLRDVPSLVPLIRHFSFLWNMNGDGHSAYYLANAHLKGSSSILDLAFIDRGALWEKIRQNSDTPEIKIQGYGVSDRRVYVEAGGVLYDEPGNEPFPRRIIIHDELHSG